MVNIRTGVLTSLPDSYNKTELLLNKETHKLRTFLRFTYGMHVFKLYQFFTQFFCIQFILVTKISYH